MDESNLDILFMELASETRRSMLKILTGGDEKLSKIAEKLDLTIQDAHRNSSRLVKSGLINKKSNNFFSLTSMGYTITQHIDSFEFLSKYNEFFQTHTTGDLNQKFIRRLGDLTNSNYISGMGPVLENLKRLGNEAEKFIKVIITQYPLEIARAYADKTSNTCSFHYIFDYTTVVPQKERDEMLKNVSWRKKLAEGNAQRRMKEKLQVCVAITEKEGVVFFPDLKGNVDILSGLFSADPQFREWCMDYFYHVWESAGTFDESKLVKI